MVTSFTIAKAGDAGSAFGVGYGVTGAGVGVTVGFGVAGLDVAGRR